jgi:hypothetical protein
VLIIDGKNNNAIDGMFTGKNNNEPKLERLEDEKEKNVPGGHHKYFGKTSDEKARESQKR